MDSVQNTYHQLVEKLDGFIRKYYINQLIRGGLYWIGLSLAIFLLYNTLEHEFYFSRGMRKFLFVSFLGISGASLFFWVIMPLLRYFRLGRIISHEQAAAIIGNHFAHVEDKLLNILQLRKQAETADTPDLILAGIQQKTESIRLVPFKTAINLSNNRKYLKYALPPVLLLIILLFAAPTVIKDSTHRILHNNLDFERDAPFHFKLVTDGPLSVPQYEDFDLEILTEGPVMPDEVFIDLEGYSYRLKKLDEGTFTYRFKNVHDNMDFSLYAGDVRSKAYTLEIIRKPSVVAFDISLDYPRYTGRKDDVLSNIGDLVIPVGTKISWQYRTLYTNDVSLIFADHQEPVVAKRQGSDLFTLEKTIFRDQPYTILLSNDNLPRADSVRYQISVIPDLYPEISVERFIDSADQKLVYFVGNTSDDYGISKLSFNYAITDEQGIVISDDKELLDLNHPRQFQYSHIFDMHDIQLKPGNTLSYYFEVHDNDAIHGSKSSKTAVMEYRMPTLEEFEEQESRNSDGIKDKLDDARKESQRLQEEMRKLREKLLQEKEVNWQNKKSMEQLLERRKQLQENIKNSQNLFEQNLNNQEEFSNPSEDIREKQEKLQEMFEEMEDEKMEDLMEKFQEMFEELEKNNALEMMEEFEMNEEEMEKQLERLMELFKQMELEYDIEKQLQKLEQLAEEQEDLSEKTDNADPENQEDTDNIEEEQESLNSTFDDIHEEMKNIGEKNNELERPKDLEESMEQMEKIDQDMDNSIDQLQKKNNQRASESQKNAAQRMRDMASQMASQMQAGQMQQMQADLRMLRQLLENLITLSFDQEDLIGALNNTNVTTPRYVALVQEQFKIQDDFKVVEDSLQALSKRAFHIETFITEKVFEIKNDLKEGIERLEDRKKPEASDHQHRTMKSLNDLALMLSEVMKQMQQQMSMMMPGNQMCNNPKPGGQGGDMRVPMDKITEGQEQLNEDMKGKKEQQGRGQGLSSEEFARMAARQAALRRALKELGQEKQQRGQGDEGLNDLIEQMDKIETDLVNKRLTNEMLKRQQEILTRLLESERAEQEREMDNQRKSEIAEEKEKRMPPALESYLKEREAEIELYKTVSPALRPYYKFLVEEYYNALKVQ